MGLLSRLVMCCWIVSVVLMLLGCSVLGNSGLGELVWWVVMRCWVVLFMCLIVVVMLVE